MRRGDTGRKETGGGDGSEGDRSEGDGKEGDGSDWNEGVSSGGDRRWERKVMGNMLPGYTTAGQNATEGIRRKSYSEVATEGVRRRASVFVGESIVRKTETALNMGDDNRGNQRKRVEEIWVLAREDLYQYA